MYVEAWSHFLRRGCYCPIHFLVCVPFKGVPRVPVRTHIMMLSQICWSSLDPNTWNTTSHVSYIPGTGLQHPCHKGGDQGNGRRSLQYSMVCYGFSRMCF